MGLSLNGARVCAEKIRVVFQRSNGNMFSFPFNPKDFSLVTHVPGLKYNCVEYFW